MLPHSSSSWSDDCTRAKSHGVLLLNEIGLDPGIDHCSARDLITRLREDGKTIESFISFCGGLPAPEFSHVPLRYKFSWRPQGVLTAALNKATYLLSREVSSDESGLLRLFIRLRSKRKFRDTLYLNTSSHPYQSHRNSTLKDSQTETACSTSTITRYRSNHYEHSSAEL